MSDDLRDLLDDDDVSGYEPDGDPLLEDLLDSASAGVTEPGPPTAGYVEPLMDLPPNEATLECLRGPCCHHWHLIWRIAAPGRDSLDMRVANTRHCSHKDGVALNGRNVFRCTRWWPRQLGFVPEWLRALMRPLLRELWQQSLVRRGYDTSWMVWPDDLFELADRPEYRVTARLEGDKRPPTLADFQRAARKARESAKKGTT